LSVSNVNCYAFIDLPSGKSPENPDGSKKRAAPSGKSPENPDGSKKMKNKI
jgi:hypothetical protein